MRKAVEGFLRVWGSAWGPPGPPELRFENDREFLRPTRCYPGVFSVFSSTACDCTALISRTLTSCTFPLRVTNPRPDYLFVTRKGAEVGLCHFLEKLLFYLGWTGNNSSSADPSDHVHTISWCVGYAEGFLSMQSKHRINSGRSRKTKGREKILIFELNNNLTFSPNGIDAKKIDMKTTRKKTMKMK